MRPGSGDKGVPWWRLLSVFSWPLPLGSFLADCLERLAAHPDTGRISYGEPDKECQG